MKLRQEREKHHSAEIQRFLLEWVEKNHCADCLNAALVDAVTKKFNWSFTIMPFGANVCPRLGMELKKLYNAGLLERFRVGLHHMERGFPKWVYSYSLPKKTTD